jgi:RNA polymerase I-specific transcription initiation factor RRN6
MVLYSKLTDLVQAFPCPFLADEPTELVPVPDPFLLDVPSEVGESLAEKGTSVHYSTLLFREIGHTPVTVGKSHYNPDMKLAKLFWIDSSLAVHESLFRLPDGKPEAEDEMHLDTMSTRRK